MSVDISSGPQAGEEQVMSKIARRLMPILVVMFLISFIDRQNVGFAKLQMLHSLGMTEAAFGLASSLFFIGYLLFEVPSTLALHRFGARVWLSRIMFTWGIITVAMGFVTSMPLFCGLRFALGVAEAGFYPGVIFYLTLWFPQSYRARVLGIFTLGSALANMMGSLVGGLLLSLSGLGGLAGWQWVFIATGLPAVLVGILVFRILPASYREARFLNERERSIVATALEREAPTGADHMHPWKALLDPRVLLFAGTYMLMSTSLYGVTYWLPTLVKSFGVSSTMNGLLNMIPWAIAVLLLLYLPKRLRDGKSILLTIAIVAGLGSLGFLFSLLLPTIPMQFIALALGGACIPLIYPCFWSMPPRYFTGARAAASVAAINSIGNLGGFFSQNLMPLAGRLTGTTFGPMIVPISCLAVLCIGALFAWKRSGSKEIVTANG
ncbi:MFS sugar transporter [Robbsia andropogonis]|uniref:MFS sugar transporter n=1 Tax=Robbsia andropogonis TaxID=28092 RepID=A0A0F5JZ85_9BURK|nr:MFS transporter [Robbsia andropogonis]KKB62602.1 MFS sugar transporter [Robbsia andropogonis]